MIKLHFYSAKWYLPVGTLIKTKTNSRFSHCSIEVGGFIYDSYIPFGVRKKEKHTTNPTRTLVMPFDARSKKGKDFIKLLDSKVGKGYDYLALFFGCWGKKIQNKERYLCSEFVALYLMEYLTIVPDIKTIFVPKDLYLFCRGFLKGLNHAK